MPDWMPRIRRAFEARGRAPDRDVLEELVLHAAAEHDALRERGCDPLEAERRVERLIEGWTEHAGGFERRQTRPAVASAPSIQTGRFAGVLQDLRYGFRLLRREPGFAAAAVLTMALGIGATTTLFSVANGVLLEPLPYADAEGLMRITETRAGRSGRVAGTISNATFLSWRDQPSTIEDLGGWRTQTLTLTGAGDPIRLSIIPSTPGLFRILRVRPALGRLFDETEGLQSGPGVIILSHGLWQERFGGSPDVLGRSVQLDERAFTVVGVMPPDFAFPDLTARAWTAWRVAPVIGQNGALVGIIFRAIARLRDGVTPEQASAEATARARGAPDMSFAATALFGAAGPIDVIVAPEAQALTADVRPAILVLLAAGVLLLATATANVAGLLLARAATRRREMAVRAAIGAGPGRVTRQLMLESAIVGMSGAATGLLLAVALHRMLPRMLPAEFPRLEAVAIDPSVMLFALGLAVIASVACGLLPARHARRVNLVETLSEDGMAPVGGTMRAPVARTRGLIMTGQVAIACVLLVGAALLSRSFLALIRVDRGYDPVNVLTARLPVPPSFPSERRIHLLDAVTERLGDVPGVTHAAYGSGLPFVSAGGFIAFNMRSPANPGVEVSVQAAQRIVSPDYFGAMRLRLVEGRILTDADTATTPPAVVVNRTFARQYLGGQPVGARIPGTGAGAGRIPFVLPDDWEVVGVVDDMRQDSVDAPLQPEVFASFQQLAPAGLRSLELILVVRTTADPASYVSTVREIVRDLAPTVALDSVMTMEERVMTSLARPRLYAALLVGFSAFALLIAAVGLFGVLSYAVAQRRREIGIRAALGAQARDIVVLVLGQAAWIVGAGVVIGFAAALASGRALSRFLYGIGPYDGLSMLAATLLIVAICGVACVLPARRAASVDPLTALRN